MAFITDSLFLLLTYSPSYFFAVPIILILMVFANYFGVSREELPLEFPLPRFAPNGSVGIWNLPVYTACPSLEHDPPPSELCNFIQVFTNWPTDSVQSLSKCQWTILHKWKKANQVFIWKCMELWVLKTILKKLKVGLNKVEGLICPYAKTYYKTTAIKRIW